MKRTNRTAVRVAVSTLVGMVSISAAHGGASQVMSWPGGTTESLQRRCDAGSAVHCLQLAHNFDYAKGVQQSLDQARMLRRTGCEAVKQSVSRPADLQKLFGGPAEMCWEEEPASMLRRQCAAGVADACYFLALRLRDGTAAQHDSNLTADLLLNACALGLAEACFTACLAEIRVRRSCATTGPEPWQSLRALVGARDSERRHKMLVTSKDFRFLRWVGDLNPHREIRTLPGWPALREHAQARIRAIAQTDPDPRWRAAAIRDIRHEIPIPMLKDMAANDADPGVRKDAQERLVRFMGPRWNAEDAAELARMAKSPDVDTRRLAVQRIEDPALLARLAEKDPDRGVREDAVDRLAEHASVSQVVLARIAERDKDDGVRTSAAALVTDQKALERLLRESRVAYVRRYAMENLAGKRVDESLLLWVAKNDGDEELRQEAVARIDNQATLAGLARSSASVAVRTVATAKLLDQELLGEIAVRDAAWPVYQAAIATIKDEAVLADVVRRRPDDTVLELVARKATDQRVLAVIAETAKEWLTRAVAIRRLTDAKVLEGIASTDAVSMVREAAKKRLRELRRDPGMP